MTRVALAVSVGMAVVALAVPAQANAACADIPGFDPFRDSDAVTEGVLLSGPSRNGVLFSPARFAVARYLKGSGRRLLRVGTVGRQISRQFQTSVRADLIEDSFLVSTGQTWRTYLFRGFAPFLGSSCDPDAPVNRARVLRRLRRTLVRGASGWRAWQLAGPGRVRCVRVGGRAGGGGARVACVRKRTAVAIAHRRASGRRTTGVAIAGRGLRRVSVGGPGLRPWTASVSAGDTVVVVVPGTVELGDLAITATYSNGATRQFGASHRRAVEPERVWAADAERPHGAGRLPAACVTVDRLDKPGLTDFADGSRSGVCGKASYFFAVRRVVPDHTLVFGGIGRGVRAVTVESPAGTRPATISRTGRAFIAALGGPVPSGSITVRLRLKSGAERVFRGRRSLNLSRRPR